MRLKASEALRLMIKRTGNSITSVSRTMGYAVPNNIVNMLSRDSVKLDMAARIADACNYKVVLVPAKMEIDDAIEVEGEA